MMKTIPILLFLFFINLTYPQESIRVIKVISVYDGDTFRADLDCDCELLCNNISIRVSGVDTPEIRGKYEKEKQLAIKAKAFTKQFLSQGAIRLENIKKGKYFRLVADVCVNGKLLTPQLIKHHLGVKYQGGKKIKKWCLK